MRLKSIKDLKILKGRRVLLRVDYNVPIGKDGRIDNKEDWRIVKSLPTIKYLLAKKAKVVIISHLGRPAGKRVKKLSLKPVAKRLSTLLDRRVKLCQTWQDKLVLQEIDQLQDGEILMLENVRFHPREKAGCKRFAKILAQYGDIYVNDAFANSHRSHTSMLAVTQYLPSYAGLLIVEEIKKINQFLLKPKRPFVGIIGGAKVSTKIKVIKKLLKEVDFLLLGGAIANTVLKAMGLAVGKSVVEPRMSETVKNLSLIDNQLRVPLDVVVCQKNRNFSKCHCRSAGLVKDNEMIIDIGQDTIDLYSKILVRAKTVFWNGPMGLIEEKKFQKGTFDLLKVLKNSKARVLIGGGESVEAVIKYDKSLVNKKNFFISTGGGAMLKYVEEGSLVALRPLAKK